MIILDTNVVSEAMRQEPEQLVTAWLDNQKAETVFLTAISVAELSFGIASMSHGKRKEAFDAMLGTIVEKTFALRILPFDKGAAIAYGLLLAKAKTKGKSASMAEGQIAAIAKFHGFTIASRDTKPYIALGIPTINPWKL